MNRQQTNGNVKVLSVKFPDPEQDTQSYENIKAVQHVVVMRYSPVPAHGTIPAAFLWPRSATAGRDRPSAGQ